MIRLDSSQAVSEAEARVYSCTISQGVTAGMEVLALSALSVCRQQKAGSAALFTSWQLFTSQDSKQATSAAVLNV